MNKRITTLTMLLTGLVMTTSASTVSVADITIPQGGTGDIQVCLDNEDKNDLTAFELHFTLPDGISKTAWQAETSRLTDHMVTVTDNGNALTATAMSADNTTIAGNSGAILTITLKADASLAPGTVLTATLHDMVFSNPDMVETYPDNTSFSITITETAGSRIVLSENATALPADQAGADVRVVRTIHADEWSTIVLPFAMSTTQLEEAFGSDMQLADFVGWTSETNGNGEVVDIRVMFERVTALEANHPYIIRLPEGITWFEVDNVDIHATNDPTVQVGRNKSERGKFIGTYTTNTTVPEEDLFISGNKFWYSAGKTRMMALRGYFELADVLESYYTSGSANISISLDDSDGVAEYVQQVPRGMEGAYDLSGRRVSSDASGISAKGIYIINGKKIAK